MTVLLLGATGFIGPHIIRALEALGCEVVPVSRRGGAPGAVVANRRDPIALRSLVRERRAKTVIDLLAYTTADTEPLLDALNGDIERWVMASSCDVYRNYEGLHRKAAPPPISELLTEDSPLRTTRYPYRADPRRASDAADAWMDDYDKIPLEAALRARPGLGGTILRLPMIFGPGDRQRRFRWLLRPMLELRPTLFVDPSWGAWRTSYGYVADVAHALATAAIHPAARGRVFNVGRSDVTNNQDWIGLYAAQLNWRGRVVAEQAPPASPIAGLDLSYPLLADSRAFREACGWSEPTPFEFALRQTIDDEERRC